MIARPRFLRYANGGIGIPVVPQLVEARLATGLQQGAVQRLARLECEFSRNGPFVIVRQRIEALEHDALDKQRLTLFNHDGQLDGLLVVAQLDVERFDPRVG